MKLYIANTTNGQTVLSDAHPDLFSYGSRLVWVFRGLYCGVKTGHHPRWFCADQLDRSEYYGVRYGAPKAINEMSLHVMPKLFPKELVTHTLRRVNSARDGVDGIPFAIHQIQDRNARKTAIRAFQESRL